MDTMIRYVVGEKFEHEVQVLQPKLNPVSSDYKGQQYWYMCIPEQQIGTILIC